MKTTSPGRLTTSAAGTSGRGRNRWIRALGLRLHWLAELVRDNKALSLILLVGLILRVSGILWGLPVLDRLERHYHPDEPKVIEGALGFPGHAFSNKDLRYPTFLHYSVGLLSTPFFWLRSDPSLHFNAVYLLGRLVSVVAGVGAILLTYVYAERHHGHRTALLASGFLAVSMYHAQNSAWATTDVTSSFFLVLFFIVARRAIEFDRSIHSFVLAGVALGLLIGTKYTGAFGAIPFVLIFIIGAIRKRDPATRGGIGRVLIPDRRVMLFLVAAIITFLITTPGVLLYPDALFQSIVFERARLARAYLPLTEPRTWEAVARALSIAMGLPLMIASVFGMLISLRGRKTGDLATIVMIVAFMAYFGNAILPRYYILVMPLLAVFAAIGIWRVYQWRKPLGIAVAVLVTLYSLYYSVAATFARFNDSRTRAAHFIEENLLEGSAVGIGYTSEEFGWRTHSWRYPSIDFTRFQEVDFREAPDFVVLSSYDFIEIEAALDSGDLLPDFTWPEERNYEWYRSSPPSPSVFKIYTDLLGESGGYCLVREFSSNVLVPVEFPPPDVRIYAKSGIDANPWCR